MPTCKIEFTYAKGCETPCRTVIIILYTYDMYMLDAD